MNTNLNILHHTGSLKRSKGGPSRSVSSLCEALGVTGVSIHLVAQDWPSPEDTNVMPDPAYVNTHMVRALCGANSRFIYTPFYYQIIAGLCRQESIRIIHDHGLWLPCNHATAKVARQLGIPLIIQPHGMLEPWAIKYRAWKKKLAWKIYQKENIESAAVLMATSQQEIESIRKVGLRRPIAMIPNGINLPKWEERTFHKERIRTALFLSRLHPIKGLLNLIAAWDRVRPEGWRMIVAGPDEGNHRADVELAVRQAGLETAFQFAGPVWFEAKEKLYRDSDLFILPTYSENFGIVVGEALAYGVPVITTKGTPWEGLLTHQCGWWIDIGIEPLAEAIREATTMSDEVRQGMGKHGHNYVAKHFSWLKIVEQVLSVYKWVLKEGPKPDCVLLD